MQRLSSRLSGSEAPSRADRVGTREPLVSPFPSINQNTNSAQRSITINNHHQRRNDCPTVPPIGPPDLGVPQSSVAFDNAQDNKLKTVRAIVNVNSPSHIQYRSPSSLAVSG